MWNKCSNAVWRFKEANDRSRAEFLFLVYRTAGFVCHAFWWRVAVESLESVLATICVAYQYLQHCNNTKQKTAMNVF
jgi:hypothetical protein